VCLPTINSLLGNCAIRNVKVLLTLIIIKSSFALEDYNLWFEAIDALYQNMPELSQNIGKAKI
jgi:hypothetical protein